MARRSVASVMAAPPRSLRLFPALIFALLATAGCGAADPEGRQPISGTVVLDGQPIRDGAVFLEPPSADGNGAMVGAPIRRGSFRIEREHGPTPGKYRVRIYASSDVQSPPAAGQTERTRRPLAERLPPAYNTSSRLVVEVTPGGSNHFRFDLHSHAGD